MLLEGDLTSEAHPVRDDDGAVLFMTSRPAVVGEQKTNHQWIQTPSGFVFALFDDPWLFSKRRWHPQGMPSP